MPDKPPPERTAAEAFAQEDVRESRILTPRNLIAFAVILIFAAQQFLPYWVAVPEGRSGDMLANGSKVVETVIVVILGFYFATSAAAGMKNAELSKTTTALAAAVDKLPSQPAAGAEPAPGEAVVRAASDVDVDLKVRSAEPAPPGRSADPPPLSGRLPDEELFR